MALSGAEGFVLPCASNRATSDTRGHKGHGRGDMVREECQEFFLVHQYEVWLGRLRPELGLGIRYKHFREVAQLVLISSRPFSSSSFPSPPTEPHTPSGLRAHQSTASIMGPRTNTERSSVLTRAAPVPSAQPMCHLCSCTIKNRLPSLIGQWSGPWGIVPSGPRA